MLHLWFMSFSLIALVLPPFLYLYSTDLRVPPTVASGGRGDGMGRGVLVQAIGSLKLFLFSCLNPVGSQGGAGASSSCIWWRQVLPWISQQLIAGPYVFYWFSTLLKGTLGVLWKCPGTSSCYQNTKFCPHRGMNQELSISLHRFILFYFSNMLIIRKKLV